MVTEAPALPGRTRPQRSGASAVTQAHEARLLETIATYDATSLAYARKFRNAPLDPYLERFASLLQPGARKVLDAGCGPGRDVVRLQALGLDVVGLDLSRGLIQQAKLVTEEPLVLGDVRELPLRTASVDGVWSCASLVHLEPAGICAALKEFRRVLRPHGALFLSVRHGTGTDWRQDAPHLRRHFHLYREGELLRALAVAGFEVVSHGVEPGVVVGDWVNIFGTVA